MKRILFLSIICLCLAIGNLNAQKQKISILTGTQITKPSVPPKKVAGIRYIPANHHYYQFADWFYAGSALIINEQFRKNGKIISLSDRFYLMYEMYEKGLKFLAVNGKGGYSMLSEPEAVIELVKKYGLSPDINQSPKKEVDYMETGQQLTELLTLMLAGIKPNSPDSILSFLKSQLGSIVNEFTYNDKPYTSSSFRDAMLTINLNDYVSFMSYGNFSFGDKGILNTRGNWRQSDNFINISPDDIYTIVANATEKKYFMVVSGCKKESAGGRMACQPFHYLIIGSVKKDGITWFVAPDFAAKFNFSKNYILIREDFIRENVNHLLVNKEAARMVLDKIIK